jgi:translation initiation factor IF-2
MANFVFNLESLEKRMNEGQNLTVSGLNLSVEIEIKELPDLLKEVPAIIGSISAASEKCEARNWSQLCDEKNYEAEKRREAEAKSQIAEAKLEAQEKKLQRKQDEIEELKEKLFGKDNPAIVK